MQEPWGVAAEAFNENKDMTEVVLPDELLYICDYAFAQCKSLTKVDASGSALKLVSKYAFYYCEKLNTVLMPSVEEIEESAFSMCSALKDVPTASN